MPRGATNTTRGTTERRDSDSVGHPRWFGSFRTTGVAVSRSLLVVVDDLVVRFDDIVPRACRGARGGRVGSRGSAGVAAGRLLLLLLLGIEGLPGFLEDLRKVLLRGADLRHVVAPE